MGKKEKKEKKDKKRRRRSSSSSSGRWSKKPRTGWDAAPQVPRAMPGLMPALGIPPAGSVAVMPAAPGAPLAIAPPPGAGALVVAGGAPLDGDVNTRRLYVLGLTPDMTEDMLKNFFKMHATVVRKKMWLRKVEEARRKHRAPPVAPDENLSPVVEVNISRSEDIARTCFAFVAFTDVDITTECLCLDGKAFPMPDGSLVELKVMRPKGYVPPAVAAANSRANEQSYVQGLPASAAGKLTLAGFPSNMGTDEIKELLTTFGTVTCFEIVSEADGASRHCCVFDFLEGESAGDECVNALNGIDIADQRLLVHRVGAGALVLHDGTAGGAGADKKELERRVMMNIINFGVGLYQSLEGLRDLAPEGEEGEAAGVQVKKPTKILALLNLFDPEDIEDDRNYDDIKAEIEREAEKYGRVVNLIMPRDPPPPPPEPAMPEEPKLLLELQTGPLAITAGPQETTAAAEAMAAGPPPGFALNVNTGVLIPYAAIDGEKQKIDAENAQRTKNWEEQCEKLQKDYEKARLKWEENIMDPISRIQYGIGKVYIEYWTEDEALKAQVALAGKQFDNRTVITSFLPEEWFRKKEAEEDNDGSFDAIMAALDNDGETLAIEA